MSRDNSDSSSLLSSLFSRALLELTVPERQFEGQPWASTSSSRDTAFYDEVLAPRLKLSLPSSSVLPPPQRGHAAYPLPVSIDERDDDDIEERTEQARATRLLIYVLLCNLHLDLRGSYVTPKPPLPAGSIPIPPSMAVTHSSAILVPHDHRPTPAVQTKDAAYAEAPPQGDEVAFFHKNWSGNEPPPSSTDSHTAAHRIQQRKKLAGSKGRKYGSTAGNEALEDGGQAALANEGVTSFVTWDQTEERWTIEWVASVPVVYSRHRHPHPAISLTSSFSLRLSPSSSLMTALAASLSGGLSLLPLATPQQSSSWADHDLLATLSSGPVYPDESPSQRAARAASALAKLPLSRLPSKVLGTRLVTPERSARDVGRKLAAVFRPPSMDADDDEEEDAEGDMASRTRSSSRSSRSSSSTRPSSVASSGFADAVGQGMVKLLSEEGLMKYNTRASHKDDVAEGDAIVTLHRSVRTAMDVRNAVGVRMRTTIIESVDLRTLITGGPDDQDVYGYSLAPDAESVLNEIEDGAESSHSGRALILCVEVENPHDSGLIFDVRSTDLDITIPAANLSGATTTPQTSNYKAEATLLRGPSSADTEEAATRFKLEQGEQRNLIYLVRFNLDLTGAAASASNNEMPLNSARSPWPWPVGTPAEEANRHVAIVVHGKPLVLSASEPQLKVVTPDFPSTWNCVLDMKSLQEDLRRRTAASLPAPDVFELMTPGAQGSASSTKKSAVVASGSARHTASALAAAVNRDHMRMVAARQSQGRDRVASDRLGAGLGSTAFAGRLGSLAGALSPSNYTSSLPHTVSSPTSYGASEAGASSPVAARRSVSQSGGIGLLAQAKMRAASARINSADEDSFAGASPLTPRQVSHGASHFANQQQNYRKSSGRMANADLPAIATSGPPRTASSGIEFRAPTRLASPNGPRNQVRMVRDASITSSMGRAASNSSTIAGGSGLRNPSNLLGLAQTSVPSRRFVVPFRISKDPHWQSRPGLLINTRIRIDEEHVGSAEDPSSIAAPSVKQMDTFVVDVYLTNRSDVARTFSLSWARLDSPSSRPYEDGGGDASDPFHSSSSYATPSTTTTLHRLFSPSSVHLSSLSLAQHLSHTALVPLSNHHLIGPLMPGCSDMVSLNVRALIKGRWSVGEVVVRTIEGQGGGGYSEAGEVKEWVLKGTGEVVVV